MDASNRLEKFVPLEAVDTVGESYTDAHIRRG